MNRHTADREKTPSPVSHATDRARRIVYTSIFGGYDRLRDPRIPSPGVRFICFTDDRSLRSEHWEIVHIARDCDAADMNRRLKINPHLHLPPHDYSLYIDGNVRVLADLGPLFDKYRDLAEVAAPRHPFRACLYDEARECIRSGKGNADRIRSVVAGYDAAGFPQQAGLHEFHLLYRRTHSPDVVRLMETWWGEYQRGGGRDQITFPFAAWRCAVRVQDLEESPRYSTRLFRLGFHNWELALPLHRRFLLYTRMNRRNSRICGTIAGAADRLTAGQT